MPVGDGRRPAEADLLVTAHRTLSPTEIRTLQHAAGVAGVHLLDTGTVRLRGHNVSVIGVAPASFRRWTPTATRLSTPLWATIASGQLSADFNVSKNLSLPLGSTQKLAGVSLRLGSLASMGLPGYDLTVNTQVGRRLRLTPGSAALVSAPAQDLVALRGRLAAATPVGVTVALLRATATSVVPVGGFLSSAQLATVVSAAKAEIGKPYVWGATGPNAYDCSGLVGWAFAKAGLRLPRTSQQLWLSGPMIPPDQAQAGDLLFWANDPAAPTDIDHVAIYLGNGLMVSAPHTGDVVHIAPVPGRNFRGIVRLDPRRASQVGGAVWSPAST